MCAAFRGFTEGGGWLWANSVVTIFPRTIAPAFFSRATAVAVHSVDGDHLFGRERDRRFRAKSSPVGAKRRGCEIMSRNDPLRENSNIGRMLFYE